MIASGQAGVNLEALFDVAEECDLALGQHQCLVAHRAAQGLRMRRQQQNPGAADELLHPRLSLLLELRVAGADAFIDQQNVRNLRGGERK